MSESHSILHTLDVDNLTETQVQFVRDWDDLQVAADRDGKNLMLVTKLDAIQWKRLTKPDRMTDYEENLWELYIEEWDHQEIVNRALREIGNKRRHDWSKDYLYIFTLAGKFQFRIPGEGYDKQFKMEITRHYNLEPHHPEFEIKSGHLNNLDIQEMAVDRLSRNLWKNKGQVNMEQMNRFTPVFHGPNAHSNLAKYKLCLVKYTDLVIQVYNQAMKVGECKDFLQEMAALDDPQASI